VLQGLCDETSKQTCEDRVALGILAQEGKVATRQLNGRFVGRLVVAVHDQFHNLGSEGLDEFGQAGRDLGKEN
jgi:hypothetical protein